MEYIGKIHPLYPPPLLLLTLLSPSPRAPPFLPSPSLYPSPLLTLSSPPPLPSKTSISNIILFVGISVKLRTLRCLSYEQIRCSCFCVEGYGGGRRCRRDSWVGRKGRAE